MSMLRNGRSLILGALWLEFPYQTTNAPLPSTLLLLVIRRDNITIKVAHDNIIIVAYNILEYNIRGKDHSLSKSIQSCIVVSRIHLSEEANFA